MKFEENKSVEKFGEKTGYVFAYFVFTTMLFFILALLKRLPQSWSYFHVMGLTLLIVLIGFGVKRLLR